MNRQQKRALGLCYDCSELADSGRTRCTKHRKSSVAITERYRKTDKGRAVSIKLRDWARKWRWHYRRNKGRFEYVRRHCLRRGKTWTLIVEDYLELILKPCFYCGLPNNVVAGVGLDRINNKKGYIKSNVVSCCIECNYIRNDNFSLEEMKMIGRVIRKIKLRRKQNDKRKICRNLNRI